MAQNGLRQTGLPRIGRFCDQNHPRTFTPRD